MPGDERLAGAGLSVHDGVSWRIAVYSWSDKFFDICDLIVATDDAIAVRNVPDTQELPSDEDQVVFSESGSEESSSGLGVGIGSFVTMVPVIDSEILSLSPTLLSVKILETPTRVVFPAG